jgi:hypothetical protein|tara:strand:- start:1371 stop:2213 length:843 start_codon:yes stop_codon:yes gene_type:complete
MYSDLITRLQKLKEEGYNITNKDVDSKKRLDCLDKEYKEILNTINKKDIEAINKTKSDIFIFHNHNLAYYCWKKLFLDNRLNKGNLLLHIDAHRDIKIPIQKDIDDFKRKSEELEKTENKLKVTEDYTLNKLWIDEYIFPAIKEEIISEILWIKPKHLKLGVGPDFLEKLFFDKEKNGFASHQKDNIPITTLYSEDLLKKQIIKDIILNIDLDYFSCREEPNKIATKEEIEKSVNNLFSIFSKANLKPKTITISLSPDYVPYNQIEFIKDLIKENIKKIC